MMNEETQVRTCDCAAPGCPLMATASRGADWVCFIHVQAMKSDWYAISAELKRLRWLSDLAYDLRRLPATDNWAELEPKARKAITLSQRGDLQKRDNEDPQAWMIRLEGVLMQSCKEMLAQK